ncbi:MAG TPA: site-specific integrase [Bryobacteraceae bacterium]|jgi:integrase|nr:site-specific integrase [Bryobacteraceae bacterium]
MDTPKTPLAPAFADYLGYVSVKKAHTTYLHYRESLRQFWRSLGGGVDSIGRFVGTVKRSFIEDINRPDILAFEGFLRTQGNADRTIHNRIRDLRTFISHHELPWPMKKKDRIEYEERAVTAYSEGELRRLFAAMTQEEHELYYAFLRTGFREREMMFLCWTDINWVDRLVWAQGKRDLGFRIKDKAARAVPVPDDLIHMLAERRRRMPSARLVFPRQSDQTKPNGKMLRQLKEIAFRSGLNCGECADRKGRSCAAHPNCRSAVGLHKFRRTFASQLHQAGTPVHDIRDYLGHSSLEVTLRYLEVSDKNSAATRERINRLSGSLGLRPHGLPPPFLMT